MQMPAAGIPLLSQIQIRDHRGSHAKRAARPVYCPERRVPRIFDGMNNLRWHVALFALVATAAFAQTPARPPITGVSHIAVYTSHPAQSEVFYVHDLGLKKGPDPENPAGVRYYVNPTQFVEVLPLPADAGNSRFDSIGYKT